jgi:hypothetical protein
MLCVADIESV